MITVPQLDLFGDQHVGTVCRACGRPLSNPDSIQAGIGPVCGGKFHGQSAGADTATPDFADQFLEHPIESQGFVFQRLGEPGWHGIPATNVPHRCAEHSPTGYEWGYGGSGPADLALNVLEAARLALGIESKTMPCWWGKTSRLALDHHQDFKWRFIATLPFEGGTIELATVQAYLEGAVRRAVAP